MGLVVVNMLDLWKPEEQDIITDTQWIKKKNKEIQERNMCVIDYNKAFDCINHVKQ